MTDDFLRAIALKVAFKPEPLRRAQAALLYVALNGQEFTADVLPKEIIGFGLKGWMRRELKWNDSDIRSGFNWIREFKTARSGENISLQTPKRLRMNRVLTALAWD